jgi:uncharacterized membrane protein
LRLYDPDADYHLCLSVVSAYFAFDLRTNSLQNSYQWWYDIDENPRFISRQIPIRFPLFMFYLCFMPSLFLFGGILGLNLWRRWYRLDSRQRRLGMLAAGAILLTLMAAVFTPAWEIGSLWFYD